jgi:hypothetical protein
VVIRQIGPDEESTKGIYPVYSSPRRLMRPTLHNAARPVIGLYRVSTAEQVKAVWA